MRASASQWNAKKSGLAIQQKVDAVRKLEAAKILGWAYDLCVMSSRRYEESFKTHSP